MDNSDVIRPTIVVWRSMCNKWIRYTNENHPENALRLCNFFDNFLQHRPGYEFTVAQILNGAYAVGITREQYADIEDHLKAISGLSLPEDLTSELLKDGSIETRSFNSLYDFQIFQDKDLFTKNKSFVEKMYAHHFAKELAVS